MIRFFAQGDILIEQISSMSRLARAEGHGRAKSAVIAEGEGSGHSHRLVGEFVFYRDDGLARDIPDQLYLGHVRVGRSTAQLLHEEHATVVLNPGVYRVSRQRQLEPTDSGPFEDTGIVGD
jgi:hypothetical protein